MDQRVALRVSHVSGHWDLDCALWYDCTGSGFWQGNVIVTPLQSAGNIRGASVNELGKSGADTTQEYATGEFYFSVLSGCDWTIRATSHKHLRAQGTERTWFRVATDGELIDRQAPVARLGFAAIGNTPR